MTQSKINQSIIPKNFYTMILNLSSTRENVTTVLCEIQNSSDRRCTASLKREWFLNSQLFCYVAIFIAISDQQHCTNIVTRSSATADRPRDALSVKILPTVETRYTTNQQQITVMELEGHSWSTCSQQPRLANCRIGVVNKLHRRRQRDRLAVAKFSKSGV